MKSKWSLRAMLCVLALPLAGPLHAQDAHPCDQVVSACKSAGFIDGDSKQGKGLWSECINPIMRGTAQAHASGVQLPQVSPQVVSACHASDPSFGEPKHSAQACQAVVNACKGAGFIDGDSKQGKGLWSECINPLMRGTAQAHASSVQLPQVSPQTISDCHAADPSFGEPKAAKPK
jgi:hypothetical protein